MDLTRLKKRLHTVHTAALVWTEVQTMHLEEKEALEAAEKLKDFCAGRNCLGCIFNVGYADCMLYDDEPCEWDLNDVEDG